MRRRSWGRAWLRSPICGPRRGRRACPFERIANYRLLAALGAGGMGAVYLAEQEPLGRRVALKIVRPELQASSSVQKRFEREARAIARLRHPGIVNVHEFGSEGELTYIAMEYVEGRALDEHLRATPQDREAIVAYGERVARALDAAHAQGVVHRDVKPQNILIPPTGRPVLLDFGIAYLTGTESTRLTSEWAGSPSYVSPEQLSGKEGEIDGRTDVYSLGVTLYEALLGRLPHEGGRLQELLVQILHEEPARPRAIDPTFPVDLEVVLLKALEKDRSRRYESAGAFADDLRAVLDIRPIAAKPPGVVTRLRKWARRRPVLATAVACLIAIAAVAGGIAWRAKVDREDDARALVAEAGALVGRLRDERLAHLERETSYEDFDHQRGARWTTPEEGRAIRGPRRRDREPPPRARGIDGRRCSSASSGRGDLDGDVDGVSRVLAALYNERAEAARTEGDAPVERYFRERVAGLDPDGALTDASRAAATIEFLATPRGADLYLFRFEEQRVLVPGGERRWIPVPHGVPKDQLPAALLEGRHALRVMRGAGELVPGDLILEIAGQPIRHAIFASRSGSEVALGDRLVRIDDEPVRSLDDVPFERLIEAERLHWRRGAESHSTDAARFDVGLVDAASLGEQGGLQAVCYQMGETRELTLPEGLVLRQTAAPRFLMPACQAGRIDAALTMRLFLGSYVAVFRKTGMHDLVLPFDVTDEQRMDLSVRMLVAGDVPTGFVHIPFAHWHTPRKPPKEIDRDFLIQERSVNVGEYVEFLRDHERWAELGVIAEDAEWEGRTLPQYAVDQLGAGAVVLDKEGGLAPRDATIAATPVVGVRYVAAAAYADWLRATTGQPYALPTHRQWVQAGGGWYRRWPFGMAFRHKWVNSNVSRPGPPGSSRVGPAFRYPIDESPLGVYEMTGNASQWLDEWWGGPASGRKQWTGGSAAHGRREVFVLGAGNGLPLDTRPPWVGFRLVLRLP